MEEREELMNEETLNEEIEDVEENNSVEDESGNHHGSVSMLLLGGALTLGTVAACKWLRKNGKKLAEKIRKAKDKKSGDDSDDGDVIDSEAKITSVE